MSPQTRPKKRPSTKEGANTLFTMRILYYNWVDNLDEAGRGGGVRQYQCNLMRGLADRPDVETVFLSSGLANTLRGRDPHWTAVEYGPDEARGQRYELVNALPHAPSHHSFHAPEQISHPPTEAAFAAFLDAKGPFDIVHFNNLEGLPAAVLAERAKRPETRFIVSLHNYYPFCPQVNLWRQEDAHCADFDDGAACVDCLSFARNPRSVAIFNALAWNMSRQGFKPGHPFREQVVMRGARGAAIATRNLSQLRRALKRAPKPAPSAAPVAPISPASSAAQHFAHRRSEMLRLMSTHCDRVLCVSERVKHVAHSFGVPERLLTVSYIGSDQADRFDETQPKAQITRPDGTLKLGYFGYLRRDKGGPFFLDALEALPQALAARVHVLVAAAFASKEERDQMQDLAPRFASFDYQNGYKRDTMDALLSDVDLGVVPVLWEDALPQVAIEIHARHIPLLTSDRGGAQELGRFPDLVFPAGDIAAFADRLAAALDGQIDLKSYWSGAMAPVRLDAHVESLIALYSDLLAPSDASRPLEHSS